MQESTITRDHAVRTASGPGARRASRRALVRRAVPPSRRGSRGRARAGHRAAARAGRRARGDRSGAPDAVAGLEGALWPHARPRARARRRDAGDRLRDGPSPPPDRRADGDADRADRRDPAERRGERQRLRERQRRGARRGGRGRGGRRPRRRGGGDRRARLHRRGPRRLAPLPLPSPHGVREDDRSRRVRRGRTASRRADPHAPPPARRPVPPRPHDRGVRRAAHRRDRGGEGAAARRPPHDPDVRVVRPARQRALPNGVPARDLRRGPHRPRREDLDRDPQLLRAALHRHDRDGAADREAGARTSSRHRSTTCRSRTPRGAA